MVKRGQATIEDIMPIVSRLLPRLRKAISKKFHVRFCEGKICELWRRGENNIKPNTMMIGVDAINFFWIEYGKSLEKTIRNILVHEALHVLGTDHDRYGYKLGFYSAHTLDTYTPYMEKQIFGAN